MKKLFVLAIFIFCFVFSNAWAGPDCIYVPIDIKVTKLENVNLHVVEQECINYPKDYIPNYLEAYFVTQSSNNKSSNKVMEIGDDDKRLREDYIDILKTPPEFPYLVIDAGSYSVSRVWNTLHIFTLSPEVKKIDTIDDPITAYQANNREGSEYQAIGFYKSKSDDFYIERFSVRAFQGHKCNACEKYNVETLKMTSKGLKFIGKRHFDMETYEQRTN